MDIVLIGGVLFMIGLAVTLLFVVPLLERKNYTLFVEKKKETVTQLPYNKKDV